MAFEGLTEKLNATFKKLRGKGRLTENDPNALCSHDAITAIFNNLLSITTGKN